MSVSSKVSRYAHAAVPKEKLPALDQRLERVLSVGEECQRPEEMKELLEKNPSPVAYDGFEPSGRMHIAQGILKKINVDKMTSAGFTYIFWVADWFAFLNLKMGGDLEKIKTVGHYFIEVWKAAGMNMDRVKFLWASDEINARGAEYWGLVLDISTKFSLTRVKRCCQIMGRSEKETLSSSQILYPCMQTADIFFMEVDVCQLGLDQRKVNMLAREYAPKNKNLKRPIILSHHMILGLKEGQDKMSKSDPDSAIFMEDTTEDIRRKIMEKAFCPPAKVYETTRTMVNPVLDYFAKIWNAVAPVIIATKDGELKFAKYEELEDAYGNKKVAPEEIKPALAKYLNQVIAPVRKQLTLFGQNVADGKTPKIVFNSDAISLKKGVENVGKSNPEGTIFIDDTEEEITKKCVDAVCPPKVFFEKKKIVNPVMDYFKQLVFASFPEVTIKLDEKSGGGELKFTKYEDLETKYESGAIHPLDLKKNLVIYLDLLIKPVRDHFTNDARAKELLEKVILYRKQAEKQKH